MSEVTARWSVTFEHTLDDLAENIGILAEVREGVGFDNDLTANVDRDEYGITLEISGEPFEMLNFIHELDRNEEADEILVCTQAQEEAFERETTSLSTTVKLK